MRATTWKALPLASALALLTVGMPASALAQVAEERVDDALGKIAEIIVAGPDCSPVKSSGGGKWYWYGFMGRDPPQPGTYYSHSWNKVEYRQANGSRCETTSYTCAISVSDGIAGLPNSKATVQWVSGGTTQSTGSYKGLAFAGDWGYCVSSQQHASGYIGGLLFVGGVSA